MPPQKTILIIGAGIAGLSAGCYAQMNGYQSHIFELHELPGGLCTAWERKGYTFDGCLHYLFGSGQGQPFNDLWQELGALQGRTIINHEEYQRITDGEKTLMVYADPDRLEQHLCDLSPADAALIRRFCEGVRQFARFDLSVMYQKPKPLMNGLDWRAYGMKMMPFVPPLASLGDALAKRAGGEIQRPLPAPGRAADVLLGRSSGHDGHDAAGLHAHRQRRFPCRRLAGIRPRHRKALPGTGRRDPLQIPGREDPGRR